MKWVLVAVLAFIVVGVVGCGLSQSDQIRLNNLMEDLRKYEDMALEIRTKVDSGDMSVADGKEIVADVTKDIERIRREAEYIQSQGYDTKDVIWGLIVAALNFAGINVYRNRKHPLTTPLQ